MGHSLRLVCKNTGQWAQQMDEVMPTKWPKIHWNYLIIFLIWKINYARFWFAIVMHISN